MNNLIRYLTTIATMVFWVVLLMVTRSNAYSFDISEPVLSLTNFLDSLDYKYKGFDIKLKGISIGETFDDNVTFTKENKLKDFITDLGGGVSINYKGKTREFELIGDVHYQSFAENNVFNNITQDVNLRFKNEFSKHDRINLSNLFTHSDAPLFFRQDFFEEQFGRKGGRFDHFKNKFNINYTNELAKQLTVVARYNNYMDIFSGINKPNSFQNKAGFGTDYILTSSTIFLFSYDFTKVQFDNEANSTASINEITTGIRQYITKKLFFEGRTGVDFIDSFTDEKLTKPLVQAALTHQIDDKSLASLSFTKKYGANPYNVDIFNSWQTSASYSRQLLERFRGSFSTFYGKGEFISTDFRQTLLGASTWFTYDIYKKFKGNLIYTYSKKDSNRETNVYTKNTVFLGLTAEF